MSNRPPPPFYTRTVYRVLAGAFGLFLVAVGSYALLSGAGSVFARVGIGALLILFGANLFWSACRATESWVSKIGPLP